MRLKLSRGLAQVKEEGSPPTASVAGARGAAGPARCRTGPARRHLEGPPVPRVTLTGARTPAASSRAWGLCSPTLSPNWSPRGKGSGRVMRGGPVLLPGRSPRLLGEPQGWVCLPPAWVLASPAPAHLGVGSLLQPPLLPLPLQPLKLLPDFGGRPPPFHNLRAEARGKHRSGPGREGHTQRASTVDLVRRWCPGARHSFSPGGPEMSKKPG